MGNFHRVKSPQRPRGGRHRCTPPYPSEKPGPSARERGTRCSPARARRLAGDLAGEGAGPGPAGASAPLAPDRARRSLLSVGGPQAKERPDPKTSRPAGGPVGYSARRPRSHLTRIFPAASRSLVTMGSNEKRTDERQFKWPQISTVFTVFHRKTARLSRVDTRNSTWQKQKPLTRKILRRFYLTYSLLLTKEGLFRTSLLKTFVDTSNNRGNLTGRPPPERDRAFRRGASRTERQASEKRRSQPLCAETPATPLSLSTGSAGGKSLKVFDGSSRNRERRGFHKS